MDPAKEHNLASFRELFGVDDLANEVVNVIVQRVGSFGVGVFRFVNAFLVAPDNLLDVLHLVIIAHRVDFGFVETVFHGVIRTDGSLTGCRFRFLLAFSKIVAESSVLRNCAMWSKQDKNVPTKWHVMSISSEACLPAERYSRQSTKSKDFTEVNL